MDSLPLYALLWGLPALLVLLVPWVVRKLRGTPPEPRMTDANFLVKMRLHNYMKESQYVLPALLFAAMVYLLFGYQDGGWNKFLSGTFLGLAVAHAGRYFTCRQLGKLLKKEEERAA